GRALFLALMLGGAAMWATGYLHDLWSIALVGLLWGTSIAITLPPLLTLVGQQTSAAERGLGTALRNTGNEWSNMLSPFLFGLVAERTSVPRPSRSSASLCSSPRPPACCGRGA